jgi:hypothetical protein
MLDNLVAFPTVIPFIAFCVSILLILLSSIIPLEHALFHGGDAAADAHFGADTHHIDVETTNALMSFLGFKGKVPLVLTIFMVSAFTTLICFFVNPYIASFTGVISVLLSVLLLAVAFFVSCHLTAIITKPITTLINNNSGVSAEIVGLVGVVKYIAEAKGYVVIKVTQENREFDINVYLDNIEGVSKGDKVLVNGKRIRDITQTEVYTGEKV